VSALDGTTIATVGTGVMAEAMIAGLLAGQVVDAARIIGSDPRAERRVDLEERLGIRSTASNADAVREADIVVLAIKPQMLVAVGKDLSSVLRPDQLIISILAGSTTRALGNALRHDAIVRAMPNTPAQVGKGMTVWYATPSVSALQRAQTSALLRSLGKELEVEDEKYVSMATAVSGTGPAYVFMVMEALIDAAVHLGFPRHVAHDLVIETLLGGTLLAQASGDHPAYLRNMVTSPAGTSAEAIYEMEKGRLRTVLAEAVFAAYRRTAELGRELEEETARQD
jgi:pyrroline-5-carboxylate reductase